MSKNFETTITCPNCGTEGAFVVWQSVNNLISPEAAEKLIDGSLFLYECPQCGDVNQVVYPCLYHDMEQHAMVQLVDDDESIEKIREIYGKVIKDDLIRDVASENKYRHRVVTSVNALREKAAIFRDGLDDRVVEVMKLVLLGKHAGGGDLPEGAVVYYACKDEDSNLLLEFVGEEEAVSGAVPQALYDDIATLVNEQESEDAGLRVVDAEWAFQFLQEG